jgi:hypothetical protein
MAEYMADDELRHANVPIEDREEARRAFLDNASQAIAGFIHLAWGGAGMAEYARRSYGMLCALRGRMRGMNPEATWQYAIDALNADIQARLRRAEHLVLDGRSEKELISHFFDKSKEYDYLHDLVSHTMHLHWERRHGPGSPAASQPAKRSIPVGSRGGRVMEKHLERAATEAVATYIEQANTAWGLVENLTDTTVVLRDRINIQRELGAIDQQTWDASGWKLAGFIESRFGTQVGRKEARLARARWKSLSKLAVHGA